MKKLLTVNDMAERYCCSTKTARRYMRQMDHMEKPLRVTEQAVESWEMERTREPGNASQLPVPAVRRRMASQNVIYISRVRPEKKGAAV